jgi:hypothetical protein
MLWTEAHLRNVGIAQAKQSSFIIAISWSGQINHNGEQRK